MPAKYVYDMSETDAFGLNFDLDYRPVMESMTKEFHQQLELKARELTGNILLTQGKDIEDPRILLIALRAVLRVCVAFLVSGGYATLTPEAMEEANRPLDANTIDFPLNPEDWGTS